MGENYSKWNNWQRINLQNIQATPAAQCQQNKWSNQKMGQRSKQMFSPKKTYRWLTTHEKMLNITHYEFSSVQSLSRVWLFETPWTAARQASLSITNSRSLLKLMSLESVMPSNHLILCHPLLLLPSIFPSIRVFSNESALHIREMQIKTTIRYHLTPVRMTVIKKSTNNKCWKGCGEKRTRLHCWWKCKLVQPLWRTVWRFLKNWN